MEGVRVNDLWGPYSHLALPALLVFTKKMLPENFTKKVKWHGQRYVTNSKYIYHLLCNRHMRTKLYRLV